MLAHNGVLKDARVLKGARTLSDAGHIVDVHGISPANEFQHHLLPNSNVEIFLSPKQIPTQAPVFKYALILLSYRLLKKVVATALSIVGRGKISPLKGLTELAIQTGYGVLARTLSDSVAARPSPDAIHIHDHVALSAACALKQKWNCPIIWDAHEIYPVLSDQPKRNSVSARIIEQSQGCIDRFITINGSIADYYSKNYTGLGRAAIVMNATVPSPRPVYDGRLHDTAGIPREQKILLYQGGFSPGRGLHHLVEASRHLNPDWSLVMMGWGNLESELREISDDPVWLPAAPYEELQQWTAGASLGVIPYEHTTINHLYCTPNKLWESPSAGVPILCTDLVEMAAMVKRNRIGFLLPRKFTDLDIAKTVNSLTQEELTKTQSNCTGFIRSNNWETYAPKLIEIYSKLEASK